MTVDISSASEIRDWAESLKDQIKGVSHKRGAGSNSAKIPPKLKDELLDALELLLVQAQDVTDPATANLDSIEQIAQAIDASMSGWQANISCEFGQSATSELANSLKQSEQLRQGLVEQESRFADLQKNLESRLADAIEQQSRLVRQRKTIAKDLRAKKLQVLLDIEREREQITERIKKEVEEESRDTKSQEIELLEQRYSEQKQETQLEFELQLDTVQEDARKEREQLTEFHQHELSDATAATSENKELLTQSQQEVDRLQEQLESARNESAQSAESEELLTQSRQEVDRLQEQLESAKSESAQSAESDELLTQSRQEVDRLQEQLESARSESAQSAESDELLTQSRQEVDRLQEQLESARSESTQSAESDELQEQLAVSQMELEELSGASERLEESEKRLQDLQEEFDDLNAEHQRERSEHKETEQLDSELEKLQGVLSQANDRLAHHAQQTEANNELFEESLQRAQQEIDDLRNQNSDLASQVARHQVVASGSTPHVQFDQESLSWEERKKLMMQQLDDDAGDDQIDQKELEQKRLEVEQIVASSEVEMQRRDQEIEELRVIVEQQSETKQGLAIGAAAIAQSFDSDELILQERKKLKEIQLEWEDKLRQAEIDVSMERAKLARERRQLESEREEADRDRPEPKDQPQKGQGKTRKWLEHLGLRDEK